MSSGRRTCVFCGGRADSVEHIFKRAFRRKLGITEFARGADMGQRSYTQNDIDGVVTTRPDPLFELKVRRVCRACNNGWMNHLDLHVEDWIVNPDDQNAYQACDPTQFRRWAIKWAITRSLIDNPTIVPITDRERLYNGDDLEEWHVFVGRAHFKEWRHTFVSHGAGFVRGGSLDIGFIHPSVALGTAVVSAIRFMELDPTKHFLPDFRRYNRSLGEPLVEIPYGAASLPGVFAHPKLAHGQTEPLFMFFTPEPVSPAAAAMRKAYEDLRVWTGGHILGAHPAPGLKTER